MTTTLNIQRFDFDPIAGEDSRPGLWVTTGVGVPQVPWMSRRMVERLVFSSGIMQEDSLRERRDGSQMRQLTNDPALDRRPTWSPDGRQIAFESTRSGAYQIWAVNSDGSDLRPLTDDPSYPFAYHAWSPVGDRMSTMSQTTWNSMIFDPRLSWRDQQPERLPPAPFTQFSSTSWSPDGRRLAGWSREGIATYDLTGRRTYEVLTHDRALLPQWVGSEIQWRIRADSSLMLLDLATKTPREILSTAPDVIRYIAVSRDGRHIFIARGAEEADIWMAQLK